MNFKLVTEHRAWWPVEVQLPNPEKAGDLITQTFEVEFIATPLDEVQRLEKERSNLRTQEERTNAEIEDFIRVTTNWRGVTGGGDNGDQDVPYSAEAMRMACQFMWFRMALFSAYNAFMTGQGRLGN